MAKQKEPSIEQVATSPAGWRSPEGLGKKERTYKGFKIKRQKDPKGHSFSFTMHKKIKGFEEGTEMGKEQVNEVSKYKLRQFIKKAPVDIGKKAYKVGLAGGPEKAPVDAMKAEKHAKYIGKASHRLGGFYRPKYVKIRNPGYGGIRKYEGTGSSHKFYKPSEEDKAKAADKGTDWQGKSYTPQSQVPWSYKDMGDRERYPRKMGRRGPYKANEEIEMNENEVENEGDEQVVQEPNVSDLVMHTIEQKPLEFQQTFADLMQQRIEDAVAEKKLEIASVFTNPSQYEPGDEEEPAEEEPEVEEGEVEEEPEVQAEE